MRRIGNRGIDNRGAEVIRETVEGGSAANPHYTLNDARNRVSSVAFSPDSKLFVSGSEDKKVRLYDLSRAWTDPSKKLPLQCTLDDATGGVLSAAFSPDSRLLASGSEDSKVRVYGLEDRLKPEQHSSVAPPRAPLVT